MNKTPRKIGKYTIVGKIGQGAMGEVFEGLDPTLHRNIAIKTIAESLGADPDLRERFRREARAAAQLNHPNIITIYELVEEEGAFYMAMELLEGTDLKELIRQNETITLNRVFDIMEQVCDGLGFAHSRGIVHRDLKPGNIHVQPNGQVKIMDFGLVHIASSDMTKSGLVMGTPNYMSPEQVQGTRVDARSDVFSLGAVFYELLTRRKPFKADSVHATMFKVVQGDREPLSRFVTVPPSVTDTVERALAAEPTMRFEHAASMGEHLRRIRPTALSADATGVNEGIPRELPVTQELKKSDTFVATADQPTELKPRDPGTIRSRPETRRGRLAPVVAAGTIAILLGIAGLFFFLNRSGPPPPAASEIDELNQALIESQTQLMLTSLTNRDFASALRQAELILEKDAGNAEAIRVRREAEQAVAEIEATVAEARDAFDRGQPEAAAAALGRVLALNPQHPLREELGNELNRHFLTQAEAARTETERMRRLATESGATAIASFRRAETLRGEATNAFNQEKYTDATQKFLEARDLFSRARTEGDAERTAERERSQARQAEAALADAEQVRARLAGEEQAFRRAEQSYRRLRQELSEPDIDDEPALKRASSEADRAGELANANDFAGAQRALEAASRALEEAKVAAARRREQAEQRAARAQTSTTSAPAAPTRAEEEAGIRSVLAVYERAIETQDLSLFKTVKPNLSADESQRIQASFEAVDSQTVDLKVLAMEIAGPSATVTVARHDSINANGRSQNQDSQQTFTLSKAQGVWVIVRIGQ